MLAAGRTAISKGANRALFLAWDWLPVPRSLQGQLESVGAELH